MQLTDSLLDQDIRPQDDFFAHVNSKWLSDNPIPDTEARWGTFNVLREEAWANMRDIFEDLQDKEIQTTREQQARDFYFTGMNFDTLAARHKKDVTELMTQIDGIVTTADLSGMIGKLHRIGVNVPWAVYVDTDNADATRYVLHLYQAGLSLPDRDYYLSDSKEMIRTRTKYTETLRKVHTIFPDLAKNADDLIKTILDLETTIAKQQRTNSELRDVEGNFNPISFDNLKKKYKNIDWDSYARSTSWRDHSKISHSQPEFMAFINELCDPKNIDDLKIYLKWHVVRKFLPAVSQETANLHFEFFGKVITGTKEDSPLWKRTVLMVEFAMGENVGQLYAKKHFPEASKQAVLQMVEDISDTFAARIERLDWMTDTTKAYAIKKLKNMKVLIGYPDKWRDFEGLKINRVSLVANIIAAEKFNHDFDLSKLPKPNDRDQWHMSPQTVNAYHDPNRLVICFPAGILQAPFFDINAGSAKNLGGIGVVIGHELTHAFDDQGSQFDAEGNVRQWQTKGERKSFEKRAQLIKDQADEFEVLPGLHLKGDLVIGESIADLGGIELAVETLTNYQQGNLDEKQARELFMNYAFTEAHTVRDQKAREFALTDPHPPSVFRVNAMVQHVDSFYDAFSLIPYDKLFRLEKERAKIW